MNKLRFIYILIGFLLIFTVSGGIAFAGVWTDYSDLTFGNIADGDSFLILDVSDTTLDATGTQKGYSWANLKLDLSYQPLDSDLTYLAGFTPSANVKAILTAADFTAINLLLGWPTPMSKGFAISAPVAADDFLVPWRVPVNITITKIYGILSSGTNVIGGFDECDSNGANCVPIDSDITFNGSLDQDDGSLSNPTVDAGDWIRWHTTSVSSPGYFSVTFEYEID